MIRSGGVARIALLAMTLALLGLGTACAEAAGRLVTVDGQPAPPLTLRDLDGNEVSLSAFRGRTVIVNFWATWCAPCVAEMPSLALLRDRLQPIGVEVLAVNLRENAARIRPFAEGLLLDFPIVRDHDGAVSKRWGVRVYPTTFVVGPDQRIALMAVGEIEWHSAEVEARVRAVATAPPAAQRAHASPFVLSLEPSWIAAVF